MMDLLPDWKSMKAAIYALDLKVKDNNTFEWILTIIITVPFGGISLLECHSDNVLDVEYTFSCSYHVAANDPYWCPALDSEEPS